MKSQKILGLALALGAAGLMLMACPSPTQTPSVAYSTVQWETDGQGYVRFSTNDPQYYNMYFIGTSAKLPTTDNYLIEATVKKLSGSKYSGYGIVFCYTDKSNYCVLEINQNQMFSLWRIVGGTPQSVVKATTNAAIIDSGDNVISIERTNGVVKVTFNNDSAKAYTVTDADLNKLGSGNAGPYASVGDKSLEDFPAVPVDVRVKFSKPAVLP